MQVLELIWIIFAYAIGSTPTGYLFARLKGVKDIRKHGSGTIGATNVARIVGKKYFPLIFFLDAFKAAVVVFYAGYFFNSQFFLLCCASAVLLGNTRSMFLQFSGGKGIATLCGVLIIINPVVLGFALGIFLSGLFLTKTVGIASVCALSALPFVWWFVHGYDMFLWWCIGTALWCIYLHRNNIKKYLGHV